MNINTVYETGINSNNNNNNNLLDVWVCNCWCVYECVRNVVSEKTQRWHGVQTKQWRTLSSRNIIVYVCFKVTCVKMSYGQRIRIKKMLLRNNIQIFFTNSIHNVCAKVSAVDYIDIIFVYKIKNCRSHGFSLYTYSAKAMSMTFIYIKMNACDNLFNV